jgi:hypothetical protein
MSIYSHLGSETEFFGRICDRNSILVSKRAMPVMESGKKLSLSFLGKQVTIFAVFVKLIS